MLCLLYGYSYVYSFTNSSFSSEEEEPLLIDRIKVSGYFLVSHKWISETGTKRSEEKLNGQVLKWKRRRKKRKRRKRKKLREKKRGKGLDHLKSLWRGQQATSVVKYSLVNLRIKVGWNTNCYTKWSGQHWWWNKLK